MQITGQEALADMLGVTPKTVIEWQEAGLPIAKRGRAGIPSEFESADVIRWFADREIARLNLKRPQDRLAGEQADKIAMQNAVTRRELAPTYLLEQVLAAAGARVAAILDAIPGAIRRRNQALTAADIEIIAVEIAKARNIAAALTLDDLVEAVAETAAESSGGDAPLQTEQEVEAK